MVAIVSTTHDPMYQFFLPITAWCWQKLGVKVVVIFPKVGVPVKDSAVSRFGLAMSYCPQVRYESFEADDNKEATYTQCSRLFAHTITTPMDGAIILSDIDMLVFRTPPIHHSDFTIWGADLVPKEQYPMCYITGVHDAFENAFGKYGNTLQQCLDNLLGGIECENMRGNYWGKDQETAYNEISLTNPLLFDRARPGTQFASNRIDRDDSFWEERLTPDIIDAHLWRPGYLPENVDKIVRLLTFMYPNDDHNWVCDYATKYREHL